MVHSQPQMTVSGNNRFFPLHWLAIIALSVVLLIGAATLYAQIEGNRGIAPVASSGDFEVNGILVDATGKNSLEARENAWREAQRKGWAKLWRETNCSSGAPALSDSALDNIVSAIIVEKEEAGPGRYRATLGVLFDRARAGQILGVKGMALRSAPMLVIWFIGQQAARKSLKAAAHGNGHGRVTAPATAR